MTPKGKLRRGTAACLLLLCVSAMLAAYALHGAIRWPRADGDVQYAQGRLTVDASHADDGYIMAKGEADAHRLKLRISQDGEIYTYDINGDGEFEVFPLTFGSGVYTVSLYQNIQGNRYSTAGTVEFSADMPDENAAFLCPNQYVNYDADSAAVALSEQICAGLESDEEKVNAVREYIRSHFLYDFVKAATASAGTLPDMDGCIESGMGICQDLTALAACMLRVQGIPTKMVIGYAGRSYHAWNSVLLNGEYVRMDVTADMKGITGDVVYVEERCY